MDSRLAGTTIAGRYDLIELLGTGGMGEVYRARDRELDELVALKVIRVDLARAPDAVVRFRHEVKLARRVTHGNVARTFELGSADGLMYCTMQLVEGESLANRLARERRLSVAEAVAIAGAMCEALVAAHAADVIHRDIKPANVLIANDGRVVLADFGIASVRIADGGDISGTPAYMAPEQARGEPPTPAADVYAVGVVLHEMVTGHRAFVGTVASILEAKRQVERLVVTATDVPPELVQVIGRATARSVGDRHATAAELAVALAPWRRPTTTVHRPATVDHLHHERTVLVVAPHGLDEEVAPIAEALHEELLVVLARGRLRVLPRTVADEPADLVLRFAVAGGLTMTATRAGEAVPALTLELPLALDRLASSVAVATRAVETLLANPPTQPDEALTLLARARHIGRQNSGYVTEPLGLLERALELRPDDARVRATLALMMVRGAFFSWDPTMLGRATEHARIALAAAPDLAESHLAAGHLALHTGEPVVAAAHYRVAIARAPHNADAHEYLGRMLLEAGYLEPALARLQHATAISPDFRSARWEVARAMALEGRWDEVDRLVGEDHVRDRPIARMRLMLWRGDLAAVRAFRDEQGVPGAVFDTQLLQMMFAVWLDGSWPRLSEHLLARVRGDTSPSHRRRSFIAQLVAEIAGHVGDVDACLDVLAYAADQGKLYDLHWTDRCPALASVRSAAGFASIRARIEARSAAIYDALYSDHAIAHGETALATS